MKISNSDRITADLANLEKLRIMHRSHTYDLNAIVADRLSRVLQCFYANMEPTDTPEILHHLLANICRAAMGSTELYNIEAERSAIEDTP